MSCLQEKDKTFSIGPFNEDNKLFLSAFLKFEVEWASNDSYFNRLQNFISQRIAEVVEVEYIYCCREEQAYFVWIIINQFDPSVRRKIYEKQKEIIRRFRDEMFDFYVVARLDQPPDSIVKHRNVELIYPL